MSINIRIGTSADIELLASFNQAHAAEVEDKGLDLELLKKGIGHLTENPTEGFYIVAERNAEAAGSLMVTTEWSEWRNGRFWWIQSVFIAPQHRRCGVYSALHNWVQKAARAESDCCGIRLFVEKDNIGAQATYIEQGMVETYYRLYEEEFDR